MDGLDVDLEVDIAMEILPTPTLDAYCVDLNARVSDGSVDPVIGRAAEIVRTIQILARRGKNNPILLGEAGVGKTAIVEGLAWALVKQRQPDGRPLPAFLEGKRVLSLDVAMLLAGAKERGELEKRVSAIVKEASADPTVIIFMDEIHTLVGAGSKENGGLNMANLFKPALARGSFQVFTGVNFPIWACEPYLQPPL